MIVRVDLHTTFQENLKLLPCSAPTQEPGPEDNYGSSEGAIVPTGLRARK